MAAPLGPPRGRAGPGWRPRLGAGASPPRPQRPGPRPGPPRAATSLRPPRPRPAPAMPTQSDTRHPPGPARPGLRGPPLPFGRGRGSERCAQAGCPGPRAGCALPCPRPPEPPFIPCPPSSGAHRRRGESGRRRAAQRRGRPASARAPARRAAPPAARRVPALRPPPALGGASTRGSPGTVGSGLACGRRNSSPPTSGLGKRQPAGKEAGDPLEPQPGDGRALGWAARPGLESQAAPGQTGARTSSALSLPSEDLAVKASRRCLSIPLPGCFDGWRRANLDGRIPEIQA